MSQAGNFFKNLGRAFGFYIILNFIFLLLYIIVGAFYVNGSSVSIGVFFSTYVKEDLGGLLAALFGPSGGANTDTLVSGIVKYLGDLILGQHITWNIFGLLWVLVPGLVTAILIGKLFCNEQPSQAFAAVATAFLIMALIPIIFKFVGAIPAYHDFTRLLVPQMYWTNAVDGAIINWPPAAFLKILFVGLFNGMVFGAIAMKSSTSL